MLIARYSLIYGLLIGAVICGTIAALITAFGFGSNFASMWFGYLVILVAMTFVFVGVKQYRDVERGGVIRFWPALGLGLAIAFVGMLAHATVWEAYLFLTDYSFFDQYLAHGRNALAESGATAAELTAYDAQMEPMRAIYANPLYRFLLTAGEPIFPVPVGLLVPIISAALLRNPRFLPARGSAVA